MVKRRMVSRLPDRLDIQQYSVIYHHIYSPPSAPLITVLISLLPTIMQENCTSTLFWTFHLIHQMHNEKKRSSTLHYLIYTLDESQVRHREPLKIYWHCGHLKMHTMKKQINPSSSAFQVEAKALEVSLVNTWEQVLGPLAAQCGSISCLLTLAAAWCKQWRLSAARVMLK